MRINQELAKGVVIVGDDFEMVRAVRKPNADTRITQEVWFKGKAGKFKKEVER